MYVSALYSEIETNFYKLLIIRLLIIAVLAYFILFMFCHCIMLLYGDAIKVRVHKIKQAFLKITARKQTGSRSSDMEELSSKIPDVAFNYKEFQEPLFELD